MGLSKFPSFSKFTCRFQKMVFYWNSPSHIWVITKNKQFLKNSSNLNFLPGDRYFRQLENREEWLLVTIFVLPILTSWTVVVSFWPLFCWLGRYPSLPLWIEAKLKILHWSFAKVRESGRPSPVPVGSVILMNLPLIYSVPFQSFRDKYLLGRSAVGTMGQVPFFIWKVGAPDYPACTQWCRWYYFLNSKVLSHHSIFKMYSVNKIPFLHWSTHLYSM